MVRPRTLATLSFHVSVFRSTGSFEVNPVDLIALEVMRVFEPAVYQRLPDAKLELTDLQGRRGRGPTVEAQMKGVVESLVNQAYETNRPQVREIVKQLFPPAEWVFGGPGYGPGFEERWFRELRVCHPDVFDRYFHLTIPEGDISQADLDRILAFTSDRQGLVTEFRSLNKRALLGVVLDRLEAYKEKLDLSHAVPFVTALFDIGDELPEEGGGFFSTSPEMHASRIIYWYLKQEKDTGKRGQILKEAMRTSTGLYLPITTASLEGNEEKRKKDPDAFNVTDADLKELHQICLEKIEQAANAGKLATHPNLPAILYRWREWGSPEKPRLWVEGSIASKEGALSFLTSCLHRSTSHGMGDHVSQEHWRINLTSVEDFVPADTLEKMLAELSFDDLSDKEKKAVKAFQKAIKRRREGKSDDGWRDHEDE